MSLRIEEVRLHFEYDDSPDYSHLGTYLSTPPWGKVPEWAIVHRDGASRGEYEWFVGNWQNYTAGDSQVPATNPRTGKPYTQRTARKWIMADYERLEGLGTAWQYMGMWAEAKVVVKNEDAPFGTLQTIRSGGLWGIEDDSDKSYIKEVADTELEELAALLGELGVTIPSEAAAIREAYDIKEVGP